MRSLSPKALKEVYRKLDYYACIGSKGTYLEGEYKDVLYNIPKCNFVSVQ